MQLTILERIPGYSFQYPSGTRVLKIPGNPSTSPHDILSYTKWEDIMSECYFVLVTVVWEYWYTYVLAWSVKSTGSCTVAPSSGYLWSACGHMCYTRSSTTYSSNQTLLHFSKFEYSLFIFYIDSVKTTERRSFIVYSHRRTIHMRYLFMQRYSIIKGESHLDFEDHTYKDRIYGYASPGAG